MAIYLPTLLTSPKWYYRPFGFRVVTSQVWWLWLSQKTQERGSLGIDCLSWPPGNKEATMSGGQF
ncbi:hypothetical protein [Streptococcus oriscaviae]|uniref:Uncharacterized protein n=1 Tax=Streptococcus oriscaviae TaxID=2781599 RepID=A0ABX7YL01_9STRE|nr:hypothetical protein [Streptococcus oriscaviae]QUE54502.1 hypothetical protein INT76_00985 [Streptococcus oriscaviae]